MKKPQKKTRKILYWILTVAVAALVLELVWVAALEKNADNIPVQETEPPAQTTAAVTETTVETEPTEEIIESTAATEPDTTVEIVEYVDNKIQTPYFTLYYPEALADNLVVVKTADSPFTLEFYAMLENKPEQRIFDIRLGENVQGNMGMVKTDSADIRVDLIFYEFVPNADWSEGEINTILAMQEAANDMLEQLDLVAIPESGNQPGIVETAPESSIVNLHAIRTPYCTLQYPVVWKEYLITEQTENEDDGVYRVLFYGKVEGKEKCLLFTVLFGGDEGEQLGAIVKDDGGFTTVNILMEELDLSGWKEEDAQILFSMQEAINELIAQLPLE